MKAQVISYVELGCTGHQSVMLRATAEAFLRASVEGVTLSCWMPRRLQDDDLNLLSDFGGREASQRIRLNFLEDAHSAAADTHTAPLARVIACVEQDQSQSCYLPYLDSFMREIATLRPNRLHARLSGTLFRPTLHYGTFPNHRGRGWPPHGKSWLYNYLITCLVAHRRFVAEILTLDPLAPVFYNRVTATRKFSHLPDYVTRPAEPVFSRKQLGLPEDRIIFLLAGGISNYKGVREFMAAVRLACTDSESFRERACVVLAGRILESRDLVYEKVAELSNLYPQVPIRLIDRRLTDREFISYVSAADVVCIPYIRFAGTSSLLDHAAAYGHPVIGPEYGLLGELIRRYELGRTCDPTVPATLRDAMCAYVADNARVSEQQRRKLSAFADKLSLEEGFGRQVCEAMLRTIGVDSVRGADVRD